MRAIQRVRWQDRQKRLDLEFQREILVNQLPAEGDTMVIELGSAGTRRVDAVTTAAGMLPVIWLSTIQGDSELMDFRRDFPADNMTGWSRRFSEIEAEGTDTAPDEAETES